MAEVFVAESAGIEGFRKQVAIKRVLPQLSKKEQFIAMFLDEARLSAHLSHSNVVSVFDIGVGDGTYFIVMEYVDGADLKAVMDYTKKLGRPVPVEAAVLHRHPHLPGPRLRPRAQERRQAAPDHPPRHHPRQRAHHPLRRGEDRGLRPRQGVEPARRERRRRHQGQVRLPGARDGDGEAGRPARRRLRRGDHPLGDARRAAPLPRRHRLPDGAPGARRRHPLAAARSTARSPPSSTTSSSAPSPATPTPATRPPAISGATSPASSSATARR